MTKFAWAWLGLNALDEGSTQLLTRTGWAEELNPFYHGMPALACLGLKAAAALLILLLFSRLYTSHPAVGRIVGGGLLLAIGVVVLNTAALVARIVLGAI
jgi:hypothetical protein